MFFAFVSGWLSAAGARPLASPLLRSDVVRLERVEHVSGTPVRVQDVSSWTSQANAFTVGFGPATHVVVWNTLLDGRFSRGEVDVVLAHELGHVRSRHVLKALGWTALLVLPTLWLVALVTRRRGGVGDPANLPLVILTLAVLALLTAPIQNVVSRRYEAEADWRALNATRDPASARQLFESFEKTSLEEPSPPLLGLPVAREPPDADAAHRDDRALEALGALGVVVGLGQVLDALDRRVLRVGVLHRREQLAHELLRHVHA